MNLTQTSLVSAVAALLATGVVTLYSASMWEGDMWFHRQLQWIGWGLLAAGAAWCLGSNTLARFHLPWLLYGAALLLLILVLFPGLGMKVNGARRWMLGLQPSEFAKPVMIITLAYYCSRHLDVMAELQSGFVRPGMLVLPFVALLFAEPDWGTAMLLATVAAIMMSVAGTRWKHLIASAAVGLLAFLVALSLSSVRWARLLALADPERWKDTFGWHVWLGLLALGRGHWLGVGLGNSVLKNGFIPELHTDSIFALVGEELGLAGTTGVVLAFVVFVCCGLLIAWRAPNPFLQLVALGITLMIGLQALINLGVAVSFLPNKGIALPFVSYGGSSIVNLLACVGLLLGIETRANEHAEEKGETKDDQ